MAKYIVEERKISKYEKSYTMPMINIIPAMVCSVPFHQMLFPDVSGWKAFGLCAAFVIFYVALSYLPIIVAVPAILGIIILTASFWILADYIGNTVVRVIVKIVIAAACGFVELAIFANATVPWMEGREANKVNIRVEK